ncbi:MAG: hypothetical protein Fues2KO_50960 [Fuerstiella sp.]
MLTGTGEYRGDRAIGYARVHVTCESEHAPLGVEIALDDHEWNNQLRDGSFADWTEAAIAGCRFALQAAKQENGQWNVHRIVGLLVDTTAEYVAIASARATWNAFQYDASDNDEILLRNFARSLCPKDRRNN